MWACTNISAARDTLEECSFNGLEEIVFSVVELYKNTDSPSFDVGRITTSANLALNAPMGAKRSNAAI
jgi:hypothetical protein